MAPRRSNRPVRVRAPPLKFVKSNRSAAQDPKKMCSKSGLLFVSVPRIYFTLPKERGCCDSHCLGKKPGCKLSETLRRESRRVHTNTRTQTHHLFNLAVTRNSLLASGSGSSSTQVIQPQSAAGRAPRGGGEYEERRRIGGRGFITYI